MPFDNFYGDTNRAEFLDQLKKQQFEKQQQNFAKAEALKKMKEKDAIIEQARKDHTYNPFIHDTEGQQFPNNREGRSFQVRRFGPYQLDTVLDSTNYIDGKTETKMGDLSNEVFFKGGEHSDKDIRKIAEELRPIGKPPEYDKWAQVIKSLKPYDDNRVSSVMSNKSAIKQSTNNPAPPLWYEEEN